jgi:uncharacterized protein YndB with AHSA1/START domain
MATQAVEIADAIEREVVINASIDTVWNLVSKTGFWVGEGLQFGHAGEAGETVLVDSKKWGVFPVHVERLDPPRQAIYHWASCFPGADPIAGKATRVEFNLEEQDGRVVVRVRESGFSQIDATEDFRAEQIRGNTDGWIMQLEALRRTAEAGAA